MQLPRTGIPLRAGLAGLILLGLGACAVPDRQPDLDNIAANVAETQDGDFGEFLYNLNEAGDKAREAQEIHDDLAAVPPYLNADLNAREKGIRLAEEAAEHRRRAEDALNRILDPLRARIAYLESLHVPQDTEVMTRSIYFTSGSAELDQVDRAVAAEVADYLKQYPIAYVRIAGYTDSQGSAQANKDLAKRRADVVAFVLRAAGAPFSAEISVEGVGEAEGAADQQADDKNRRVDILVAPHGTYDRSQ